MNITNRFIVTYKKKALSLIQMEIKRRTMNKVIFLKTNLCFLFLSVCLVLFLVWTKWIYLFICLLTGVPVSEYPSVFALMYHILLAVGYKEIKYV